MDASPWETPNRYLSKLIKGLVLKKGRNEKPDGPQAPIQNPKQQHSQRRTGYPK